MLPELIRAVLVPVSRLAFRTVVEGREHVPREGPVILAANHLSFLDSFLIPLVSPRPVAFLAKAEYFTRPGLLGRLSGSALLGLGAVAVPRGEHRAAQAALETALGVLRDGRAFGIHPEGSRSRDGRLYRGRTGVAWLALASGAPVVPVAVIGTDRIQPVGARFPRPASARDSPVTRASSPRTVVPAPSRKARAISRSAVSRSMRCWSASGNRPTASVQM